jgi:hypothetical protein
VSDAINWKELGKQTQEAGEEARRRAAAEAERERERIRLEKLRDTINAAAATVMDAIRTQCAKIAEQFNSGIREAGLKMVLSDEVHMGIGLTSFVVRKDAGFPQMKINLQDMGKILISLSETRASGASGQIHRYKVDEQGQISGPDGTPNFTVDEIATGICKGLLEAKYLS